MEDTAEDLRCLPEEIHRKVLAAKVTPAPSAKCLGHKSVS